MHRARRGLRVGMASSPTMRLNGLQNSVHARHIIAMVAVKEVAGGAAKPRHAISIEGMLFAARVKGWLAHFCAMRSEESLALTALYPKADPTYRPLKDATSRRWHVRTVRGEFEILTTGAKW